MADQYNWPATFRASARHDHVQIVEQRLEVGRVAPLAATAPMAALVHGVDNGAARREPFREVLVATTVLAQPVHQDEAPLVRHSLRFPAAQVEVEPVRRLEGGGRLLHGLSWRKPR